ncbi:MAG: hypothetical protein J7623_10960 [Chitinophaga sp.]|uniref:hypothetical protein n=1 Tax=Chitinophaga sp. TaxID=1869181 RepID=UPI001B248DD7|nr:hypothetical protein [Chitinophaga sp.]MBO9729144.1 hypothetical protein [Chitinophaga sp.]
MPQNIYLFLTGLTLFASCCPVPKKEDCKDAVCPMVYSPPTYAFKLIDPATGHDLVYGPYAQIPLDSIKIQMTNAIKQVGQIIDTPHQTAVLTFYVEGPEILRVGRPGLVKLDKLNFTTRPKNCCFKEVASLSMNDSPVPVKQDGAGVFLIPYHL